MKTLQFAALLVLAVFSTLALAAQTDLDRYSNAINDCIAKNKAPITEARMACDYSAFLYYEKATGSTKTKAVAKKKQASTSTVTTATVEKSK